MFQIKMMSAVVIIEPLHAFDVLRVMAHLGAMVIACGKMGNALTNKVFLLSYFDN